MSSRWEPSIADQLDEVAASLVDVSYVITAIAEQLREKPTKRGKDGAGLSNKPDSTKILKRYSGRARRRSVLGSKVPT